MTLYYSYLITFSIIFISAVIQIYGIIKIKLSERIGSSILKYLIFKNILNKTLLGSFIVSAGLLTIAFILRIMIKISPELKITLPPNVFNDYIAFSSGGFALLIYVFLFYFISNNALHNHYQKNEDINNLIKTITIVYSLIILFAWILTIFYNMAEYQLIYTPSTCGLVIAYTSLIAFNMLSQIILIKSIETDLIKISKENFRKIEEYFLKYGIISRYHLENPSRNLLLIHKICSDKPIYLLKEKYEKDHPDMILFPEPTEGKLSFAKALILFSPTIFMNRIKKICKSENTVCLFQQLFDIIDENRIRTVNSIKIIISALLRHEIFSRLQ